MLLFYVEIVHRPEDRNRRPHQEQVPEIDCETIDPERVIEAIRSPRRQSRLNLPYTHCREQHASQRACGVEPFPARRNHQVDQQNAERKNSKLHHRQHQPVFDRGKTEHLVAHFRVKTFRVRFRNRFRVGHSFRPPRRQLSATVVGFSPCGTPPRSLARPPSSDPGYSAQSD